MAPPPLAQNTCSRTMPAPESTVRIEPGRALARRPRIRRDSQRPRNPSRGRARRQPWPEPRTRSMRSSRRSPATPPRRDASASESPQAGPGGAPRRRMTTTARAPASASARITGRTHPMPGPESLDDPRSRAGVGAGAVAAAAAAVALPSGPCLSSLRTVLGEIRDSPDAGVDPPVAAVPRTGSGSGPAGGLVPAHTRDALLVLVDPRIARRHVLSDGGRRQRQGEHEQRKTDPTHHRLIRIG